MTVAEWWEVQPDYYNLISPFRVDPYAGIELDHGAELWYWYAFLPDNLCYADEPRGYAPTVNAARIIVETIVQQTGFFTGTIHADPIIFPGMTPMTDQPNNPLVPEPAPLFRVALDWISDRNYIYFAATPEDAEPFKKFGKLKNEDDATQGWMLKVDARYNVSEVASYIAAYYDGQAGLDNAKAVVGRYLKRKQRAANKAEEAVDEEDDGPEPTFTLLSEDDTTEGTFVEQGFTAEDDAALDAIINPAPEYPEINADDILDTFPEWRDVREDEADDGEDDDGEDDEPEDDE